jgi:hypothetical protein
MITAACEDDDATLRRDPMFKTFKLALDWFALG